MARPVPRRARLYRQVKDFHRSPKRLARKSIAYHIGLVIRAGCAHLDHLSTPASPPPPTARAGFVIAGTLMPSPLTKPAIYRLIISARACSVAPKPMSGPRRSTRLSAQTEAKPLSPTPQSTRKRKAAPDVTTAPRPVTPTKRRAQYAATQSITSMSGEHGDGPPTTRHKAVARIADPTYTNATLVSPKTSRLVASRDIDAVSPSKTKAVRTTTQTILQEACDHLIKVDERLRPLIEKNPCRMFSPEGLAERVDPFESLASGIISQQVSGAAAKSIKAKFVGLFSQHQGPAPRFPHPSEVAQSSLDRLRTAGLSQRKAEYIQGLADKFASRELSAKMLHEAPYDELVEKLIAVRGLGRWSVEMFACFGLKRMDVFSTGDLGVQRGMAAFAGRDVGKLKSKGGKWKYMSEKEMLDMSVKFAPYRSLFMWLMWRAADSFTDVSSME